MGREYGWGNRLVERICTRTAAPPHVYEKGGRVATTPLAIFLLVSVSHQPSGELRTDEVGLIAIQVG